MKKDSTRGCLAILTSGGDSQGMNAALRAAVRTGLSMGWKVLAIHEGYRGLVAGGDLIKEMNWASVGGILHRSGTVIGTARCREFFEEEGRKEATYQLLRLGIDRLLVIGGDGSLTAADILRREFSQHAKTLIAEGRLNPDDIPRTPCLGIAGLVGSIDNDMSGTDMTIGADTALHRITEAVDALSATAASHQRTFVVEVMGRHCGYLAITAALAGGADWVLFPEDPPQREDWELEMVQSLRAGREAGRRDSIVIVAEGARTARGRPISAQYVKETLEHHLDEEVRLTVLGHVQRGGGVSAFDRSTSTILGWQATRWLLETPASSEPQIFGVSANRVHSTNLAESVQANAELRRAVEDGEFETALKLRGPHFRQTVRTFWTMVQALPVTRTSKDHPIRLGILTAGDPAPGMNTAVRAAVRLALDEGVEVLGIRNGFNGILDHEWTEMNWMSVRGWGSLGGSELGLSLTPPDEEEVQKICAQIRKSGIDGLLVIGGWTAWESALKLKEAGLKQPVVCLPASIDNNLPGSELALGADTALNSIVNNLDKIKQSAVASNRCFVVEVMGDYCGYLALLSAIASGAERAYLHEEGVTLKGLQQDVRNLVSGFEGGKRLGLMIRSQRANECYTTRFMMQLFEEEGGDLFDVRQSILGHLQQGGDPTPFDRIHATRLATFSLEKLLKEVQKGSSSALGVGLVEGRIQAASLDKLFSIADREFRRPENQWWLSLAEVARQLA